MVDVDIPSTHNLGSFYQGVVHVVTKDSSIHPTSAVRQVMEIGEKNSMIKCVCFLIQMVEEIEITGSTEFKHLSFG